MVLGLSAPTSISYDTTIITIIVPQFLTVPHRRLRYGSVASSPETSQQEKRVVLLPSQNIYGDDNVARVGLAPLWAVEWLAHVVILCALSQPARPTPSTVQWLGYDQSRGHWLLSFRSSCLLGAIRVLVFQNSGFGITENVEYFILRSKGGACTGYPCLISTIATNKVYMYMTTVCVSIMPHRIAAIDATAACISEMVREGKTNIIVTSVSAGMAKGT